MKQRAITGVIFVLVLLACLLAGQWPFIILFSLVALLSLNEFYTIVETGEIKINRILASLLALLILAGFTARALHFLPEKWLLLLVPFCTLIMLLQLFKTRPAPIASLAFTFFGLIYVILPFLFFILLGLISTTYSYHFPLGFLVLLWCSDTGAYLAGRSLGKTKLFERHSPKKTWEGFIGGMLLSVLAGFIFSLYVPTLSWWQWMGSALIISVFGTFGDLCESMLKRSYKIKDSGTLLPGHGGLLDRFDGLLLAAPLVYLFLQLTL